MDLKENTYFEYRDSLEMFKSECQINVDILEWLEKANPSIDIIPLLCNETLPSKMEEDLLIKILNFSYYLCYNDKHVFWVGGGYKNELFKDDFPDPYYREMANYDIPDFCSVYIRFIYCLLMTNVTNSAWLMSLEMSSSEQWDRAHFLFAKYSLNNNDISPSKLPSQNKIIQLKKKIEQLEKKVAELEDENQSLKERPLLSSEDNNIMVRVQIKVILFLLSKAGIDIYDPLIEKRRIKTTIARLICWLGIKWDYDTVRNCFYKSLDANTHSQQVQEVNDLLRKINTEWRIKL